MKNLYEIKIEELTPLKDFGPVGSDSREFPFYRSHTTRKLMPLDHLKSYLPQRRKPLGESDLANCDCDFERL